MNLEEVRFEIEAYVAALVGFTGMPNKQISNACSNLDITIYLNQDVLGTRQYQNERMPVGLVSGAYSQLGIVRTELQRFNMYVCRTRVRFIACAVYLLLARH